MKSKYEVRIYEEKRKRNLRLVIHAPDGTDYIVGTVKGKSEAAFLLSVLKEMEKEPPLPMPEEIYKQYCGQCQSLEECVKNGTGCSELHEAMKGAKYGM